MSYEVPADSWIQRAHYVFTGSDGVVDLNAYGRVEVVRGRDVREAYLQPDLAAVVGRRTAPESVFPGVGRRAGPGVRRRGGSGTRAVGRRGRGPGRDRDGRGGRAVGRVGSVGAAAAGPRFVEARGREVDPDEARLVGRRRTVVERSRPRARGAWELAFEDGRVSSDEGPVGGRGPDHPAGRDAIRTFVAADR